MNGKRAWQVIGWVATGLAMVGTARGDESLADRAARSVHLSYPGPEGVEFHNRVRVVQSQPGTYFSVCAFNVGYFGMQELADGRKILLFSIWDAGHQDNPAGVPEEQRVRVVSHGPDVTVTRFGGEGTGAKSFVEFNWQPGTMYEFAVRAVPQGSRTAFTGYFLRPDTRQWQEMATLERPTGGKLLRDYYAFVEDFRRNRVSATQVRKAYFSEGRVKMADGKWVPLRRAKFTADGNPAQNIDAGVEGREFFLVTGGETRNEHTRLWQFMELPEPAEKAKPN